MVPDDLSFDVERTSVRVVLLEGAGRLLLFRTIDPTAPHEGLWYELPGGGMEPGESVAETAARELCEETGIQLPLAAFGLPGWTRSATYLRRGTRFLQHEVVVAARVDATEPPLTREGQTPEELSAYVGHVWWTPAQVASSTARFFPGRLPSLVEPFLAGEQISEPFELWN